jgi:hypothetical protein
MGGQPCKASCPPTDLLETNMRASDVTLLARKIAVGIVITIVPLGIVVGSLWLTERAATTKAAPAATHSKEASHAN